MNKLTRDFEETFLAQGSTADFVRKQWRPNPRLTILRDINSTASGIEFPFGESDSSHS